jgi:hypothetical protein
MTGDDLHTHEHTAGRRAANRERLKAYERIRNLARIITDNMERSGGAFTYIGDAFLIERLREELDAFDRGLIIRVAEHLRERTGGTWVDCLREAKEIRRQLFGATASGEGS